MDAGLPGRAGIEENDVSEGLGPRARASLTAGPAARARVAGVVARVVAALAVALTAAACGGDDDLPDPGPESGLSPDQPFVGMPETDAETLCDWVAGRFGGYGRRVDCSDGSYVSSAPSRAECVRSYQTADDTCSATVSVVEDCVNNAVEGPCTAMPVECIELVFCAL